MSGWVVDPVNNIEVGFAALKAINPVSSSLISRYSNDTDGMPMVFHNTVQPFEFVCIAEITNLTLFDTIWRKMNYFEKTGTPVLLILPSENKALEGYVENVSNPIIADRLIHTMSFKFVAGGFVIGYMKGAADMTITGTLVTDTDANADRALKFDAQNENGYFMVTQSAWALPGLVVAGGPYCSYRLYARAKDSAQVASDLLIAFNNSSNVGSPVAKTLTSGFKWYYTDYTLVSTDNGDSIKFLVNKETAAANSIYVDMLVMVQHYIT